MLAASCRASSRVIDERSAVARASMSCTSRVTSVELNCSSSSSPSALSFSRVAVRRLAGIRSTSSAPPASFASPKVRGANSWRPSTRPPAASTIATASLAASEGASTVRYRVPTVITERLSSATGFARSPPDEPPTASDSSDSGAPNPGSAPESLADSCMPAAAHPLSRSAARARAGIVESSREVRMALTLDPKNSRPPPNVLC